MRVSIFRAVVAREMLEIVRNRLLLYSVFLPPVILTVLPLIILRTQLDSAPRMPQDVIDQLVAGHPEWAGLTAKEVAAAFTVRQFLNLFLIMPGYIPLAIASYSIVGEKQARSLEAVLATPIRTTELLGGKAIAALVPGVLTSWVSYVVLVLLAGVLLGGRIVAVLTEPTWFVAVLLAGPAVGLVSVAAGVVISSRVNDPRAAQQIGAVIILPIAALIVLQTTGHFVLGAREYLLIAIVVALIGIVGLRAGVRIFGRETILTRWK